MHGSTQDFQSLDPLGLDAPFAETSEPENHSGIGAFATLEDNPFVAFSGEAEWTGARESQSLDEEELGSPHSFANCTSTQKQLLLDVTERCLRAVRHAASFVGSAYGRPDRMGAATRQLLLRHFHTTKHDDLRHIVTRLMRIEKALKDGIKFRGETDCATDGKGAVCGYALTTQLFGGFGKVHICFDTRPRHCNFSALAPDAQEVTLIHEVAHRYVGIKDQAYEPEPKYSTLSPKQALDNADSYAFFAVEGMTLLSESFEPELEGSLSEDYDETSFTGLEAQAWDSHGFSADNEAARDESSEPWARELEEARELESGASRCAEDEHEGEDEYLESEAWTATAEQIAFRNSVLAEHIARSRKARGAPLPDLSSTQVETIPGTSVKTRPETARAAGRLLTAANADLQKAQIAGDADALRTKRLTAASGYRGSEHQRSLWLRYFKGYYNRTRAHREALAEGPHSKAAAAYMLKSKAYGGFGLGGRIAAPGYSNHQNGIAVDFYQNRKAGFEVANGSSDAARAAWRRSWFYGWLKQNAAAYGFEQLPTEEWHWEFRRKPTITSEFEIEAVVPSTKPYLDGALWIYRSRVTGTKIAVFASAAAVRGSGPVDMLLYIHGLLSPCGVPRAMPAGIVTEATFRLGKIVTDSGRPMLLIVPQLQIGSDAGWSAHGLDRPAQLNALFAEVLGETDRRLERSGTQIGRLVISGHSRAYGVLYPLANANKSTALGTGALAKLVKVWVLDATYGSPPIAAFKALAAARPGLGVDIVYRAKSQTDKFDGRASAGAVALRPVPNSITHCALPGKLLPTLLSELGTAPDGEAFENFDAMSSAETHFERGDGESLAWLDVEAGLPGDKLDEDFSDTRWPESSEDEIEHEGCGCGCGAHSAPRKFEAEWFEPESDDAGWPAGVGVRAFDTEAGGAADLLQGASALVVGPTLRRGNGGAGVEALQRALAQLGHSPGEIDGRFGAATEKAVLAFQSGAGLAADGVVGPRTKAGIAAALGGKIAPLPTPPAPIPPAPTPPAPLPVDEDLDAFIARLAAEWSRRTGGKPSADERSAALRGDYEDTLKGARMRFGTKYADDVLRRAWMISREEEMRFRTEPSGGSLGDFGPPAQRVELVSHASIDGSDKAPVAPIMVRFFAQLHRRYGAGLGAGTYRGHGGGSFNDRGYSLDLFLNRRDARGFYLRDDALSLLRAVNETAKAMPAKWRIIYNDFAVADEINRETGKPNVIFAGTTRKDKNKRVTGLNWHGPHPLIIHFHLDLAPLPGAQSEAEDEGWQEIWQETWQENWQENFSDGEDVRAACEGESPADETLTLEALLAGEAGGDPGLVDRLKGVAEFMLGPTLRRGSKGDGVSSLQRALVGLGYDLAVDGDFGSNTEGAVHGFQSRSGLEADGVVGAATKAAIGAALGGRSLPPAPAPTPPAPTPLPYVPGKKLAPKAFVATFGESARASQAASRVPALVTLGQAALESGWGAHAPGFNFFGIKAKASMPENMRQLLKTKEVMSRPDAKFPEVISVTPRPDGKYDYVVRDWFRVYPDAATAFSEHGSFLARNKRYAKAFAVTHDPYAFATEVARAGYATGPTYGRELHAVMRMIEKAGGG
ncbi:MULTISPECIES: peptidoglycan-binding protein [Bradyrhizobium]|uniref:peptidoglycan-binding protein n=2 Tax=Bradyrhizobium TaxID=374 RepID=UPI000409A6ED|nr:peptidoglycan-binding protein [Bradyrhizobium elkanii]